MLLKRNQLAFANITLINNKFGGDITAYYGNSGTGTPYFVYKDMADASCSATEVTFYGGDTNSVYLEAGVEYTLITMA